MGETVMIDLGEVRDSPRLVLDRPASPARRRAVRLAVVAALLMSTVSLAAPVEPELIEATIPADLGDGYFTAEDRLYIVRPDASAFSVLERTVAAYRLPDGGLLWEAPLPTGGGAVRGMSEVADTLIFLVETVQGRDSVQTVALDAATARLLWRRPGHTSIGRDLIVIQRSDPVEAGTIGPAETWEGIEPHTGRVRWSYRTPAGAYSQPDWSEDDGPTRLLVSLPSGLVEVRDLGTGELLGAVQAVPAAERIEAPVLATSAGDLLLTTEQSATRTVTTAYGLPGLDRRWQMEAGPETYLNSCGAALCGSSPTGDGARLVDPATGQTRWTSDNWEIIAPLDEVGSRLLVIARQPPAANGDLASLAVLDASTGAQLVDLDGWQLLDAAPGQDGGMLLVRYDLFNRGALLARIDPTTLAVRAIGRLSEVGVDCHAVERLVICRRADSSVGIWRQR